MSTLCLIYSIVMMDHGDKETDQSEALMRNSSGDIESWPNTTPRRVIQCEQK